MTAISQDAYDLSPQQKRVWTLHGQTQRVQAACVLEGAVDERRLWQAVRQAVAPHEIFRTHLTRVAGLKYPLQDVTDDTVWETVDASGWNVDSPDLDLLLDALFEREACDAVFREDAPPLRFALIPVHETRRVLLASASNLWGDPLTLRNVFREIAAAYGASGASAASGASEPVQYVDYVSWRDELSTQTDEAGDAAGRHWRRCAQSQEDWTKRLPGQTATNAPGAAMRTVPFQLTPSVVERLTSLASDDQHPLESVLLACWGTLLHRFIDAADIPVGIVVSGRPYDELSTAMGPYEQVVPLLMPSASAKDVATFVQDVRDRLEQTMSWQNYHRWPDAGEGRATFCPFGYAFTPRAERYVAAGVIFAVSRHRSVPDRFELRLDVRQEADRVEGVFTYDPRALAHADVKALARRFEILCAAAAERPRQRVADLRLLTSADEQQLLVAWNDTVVVPSPGGASGLDEYRCLHEHFEAQVARTPDATAVVCGGRSLTYRELDERASRLARRLCAAGAARETPVCLLIGRSVDLVVSILATLKSDAAYVPLDTTYPLKERIAHVLRETQAPVVLTQTRFLDYVSGASARILCVDEPEPADVDLREPARSSTPDTLAYIIYTSGSTGTPKGVAVQHRSAINLWNALRDAVYAHLPARPLRVTLNAPISFDASVKQLVTLLGGHALHVLPEEVRGDPAGFVRYIREQAIDVLDGTPSHLRALLEAGLLEQRSFEQGSPEPGSFDRGGHALAGALIGGEAIDETLWSTLADDARTTFYNVYGPTECTVDTTAIRITRERMPSIGGPLRNVKTYVLDRAMRLQPPGVPGELFVGGAGLARGYWARPDLTADRFVPHPFGDRPGDRLYRTGDRVRHLPDGTLQYLGRVDQQVKLRGFRVELDEIAAALLAHPDVREAAVKLVDDPGNARVVAYIAPARAARPSAGDLRAFLATRLPEYMIPVAYVTLNALPTNAHGKVDRKALPDPEPLRPELSTDFQGPSSEVEIKLAEIWSAVLNVDRVGVRDNFFALGGHSLLAMRMVARMRKEFAMDIALPRLFQLPTIAALAEVVEQHLQTGALVRSIIPAVPR